MAAAASNEANRSEQRTLGDILYADKDKLRVSEEKWINLVRSVAAGNQLALHSLFDRSHRIVFTLAVRITNNAATAEEITVDVFHEVWRRASTYDPAGGSVLGWIMNLTRSRAIDRLRFEQRKKRTSDERENPLPQNREIDPEDAIKLEEQSRLLGNALKELAPEEREVIETAFFSELTYNETAIKLNQPLGTVKTRIRSGLSKLREALGRDLR